ncbi:MAG: SH3 domain-containing protein, partial [Candidatus Tectomicrobia bacterium]
MLQRKSLASGLLLCFLLCIYASVAAKTLTVDVPRANVRTGPGIKHTIVLTLRRGAIFPILETQQGWHKIYLDDGREVWIAGSIVQIQQDDVSSQVLKSASALPPQETPRQILTSASALPPQE